MCPSPLLVVMVSVVFHTLHRVPLWLHTLHCPLGSLEALLWVDSFTLERVTVKNYLDTLG